MDGRKYRHDDAGIWHTYKIVSPLIHSDKVERNLKNIISKGEIKFTNVIYHRLTCEMWIDTSYPNKILTESLTLIPNAKIIKQ
tara:strand:- start:19404 stop:19652 length:249 start_codon:yes stop_codon:yes gene_type:complete